jgi:murein DD-endopeptidase MepM/ murein hydrolase activator NlpD
MRLRLTLRVLPLTAAVLASVLSAMPTRAAVRHDRRRDLQNQISEASKAERSALTQLRAIQSRRAQIDARVNDLDGQRVAAEARLAPLETEAARLAALATDLQVKVDDTRARLVTAQRQLNRTAAGLYRSERRGASYDSVLASRPNRMVVQQQYLDRVSDQRRGIVERVTELRDDLEQQQREVAAEKAKADAAAAEARTVRDQIAQLRSQIEPARADAAQQQLLEQQSLEGIRASKAQYEAELAALQATSDSIAARLRARGGSGGGAPCEARPVPGPIVSGFGPRYHPILHYNRMHTGADLSAGSGTPIHACRGGVVVIAGAQGGYGNAVVIDDGGGMGTLYAHQSRLAVSAGDTVKAGDVIGYVGSTGMSTGPHLHFEVRLSGNPVDPTPDL